MFLWAVRGKQSTQRKSRETLGEDANSHAQRPMSRFKVQGNTDLNNTDLHQSVFYIQWTSELLSVRTQPKTGWQNVFSIVMFFKVFAFHPFACSLGMRWANNLIGLNRKGFVEWLVVAGFINPILGFLCWHVGSSAHSLFFFFFFAFLFKRCLTLFVYLFIYIAYQYLTTVEQ